jgi:succinate dehydrogenase/fumarate reductase cytochrome b subunit
MASSQGFVLKVAAVLLVVPAVVSAVVGLDFLLRGLGLELLQLNLPRQGVWAVFVGACCLATAWFAKQGAGGLWKRS